MPGDKFPVRTKSGILYRDRLDYLIVEDGHDGAYDNSSRHSPFVAKYDMILWKSHVVAPAMGVIFTCPDAGFHKPPLCIRA
jgi:hypothetical protein